MEREEEISGTRGDRVLQLVLSLLVFFLPLPVWTVACERRVCLDRPSSSRAVHEPSFPFLALSVGFGHSWGKWKRRKIDVLELQLNIWKVNCIRKAHKSLHWTLCSGVSVLEVWSLLSKKCVINTDQPLGRTALSGFDSCTTVIWLIHERLWKKLVRNWRILAFENFHLFLFFLF